MATTTEAKRPASGAPTDVRRRTDALAQRLRAALRTEAGLFRLAVGVLALHVVDDSFLQPASGTSAAGHLASGLSRCFSWAWLGSATRVAGRAFGHSSPSRWAPSG